MELVDEHYTSQKCSVCGVIKKSNRKYRGLYVCSECKMVINADVNGARNILFSVVPNPEWGLNEILADFVALASLR